MLDYGDKKYQDMDYIEQWDFRDFIILTIADEYEQDETVDLRSIVEKHIRPVAANPDKLNDSFLNIIQKSVENNLEKRNKMRSACHAFQIILNIADAELSREDTPCKFMGSEEETLKQVAESVKIVADFMGIHVDNLDADTIPIYDL